MMYPYIIENGGNHPANLSKKIKKKIYNHIEKIRKGYNLNNGPLKCDLILNKNRIYTLEASQDLVEDMLRHIFQNFCTEVISNYI